MDTVINVEFRISVQGINFKITSGIKFINNWIIWNKETQFSFHVFIQLVLRFRMDVTKHWLMIQHPKRSTYSNNEVIQYQYTDPKSFLTVFPLKCIFPQLSPGKPYFSLTSLYLVKRFNSEKLHTQEISLATIHFSVCILGFLLSWYPNAYFTTFQSF